jgi:hypothetical protein
MLVFDANNWHTVQVVTVTGRDDDVVDGTQPFDVLIGPSMSEDPKFEGLEDVKHFTNTDDDVAGLRITATQPVSSEAGRYAIINAALNSKPKAPILFSISSSDATEGIPDPSIFVLSQQNWRDGENVNCYGQADTLDDGDIEYFVSVTPITTQDPDYISESQVVLSVKNEDDPVNKMRIGVSPLTCVTSEVQEGGKTCAIHVQPSLWWNGESPYESLTVKLTSSEPREGNFIQPDGVTILPYIYVTLDNSTWQQGSTVVLKGADDRKVDYSQPYNVTISASLTSDAKVPTQPLREHKIAGPIAAINEDDDVAGITMTPGCNITAEAGDECTYYLTLQTEPAFPVIIESSSSNEKEGNITVGRQVVLDKNNWDEPQPIIIKGIDDEYFDKDQPYTVTIGPSRSDDPLYVGKQWEVNMVNIDNDIAEMLIRQNGLPLRGYGLPVDETGIQQTFTIQLPNRPESDVTIDVKCSDMTEALVVPSVLVFTTANWMKPTTVTIIGQDDKEVDGDQTFSVTLTTSSTDDSYANVEWYFFVVNKDDDGLTLSRTECVTTESFAMDGSGQTGDFGGFCVVELAMRVWRHDEFKEMTFLIESSDSTEGRAFPNQLKFYPDNFLVPQKINITGLDDLIDDGDVTFRMDLIGRMTYLEDTGQPDKEIIRSQIAVVNQDDDTAGIRVVQRGNVTDEAGTLNASFTVVLDTEPAEIVYVPMQPSVNEGVLTPSILTFSSANWNTPQEVLVKGMDDMVMDYDQEYTVSVGPIYSVDPPYNGQIEVLEYLNLDDDNIGLFAYIAYEDVKGTPVLQNRTSEDGTLSGKVRVRLLSQPKATVLFTVSTSAPQEAIAAPSIIAFSQDDWRMEQQLTVFGEDDLFLDGDFPYTLRVKTLYTSDPDYREASLEASLDFRNEDDSGDRSESECELGLYGVYPSCRKCPIGTYSDTTTSVLKVSDCKKCPYGTHGTMRGAQTKFGHGPLPSDAACRPCPEGSFSDIAGLSTCQVCPRGFTCPIGATFPSRTNFSTLESDVFHHWVAPKQKSYQAKWEWLGGREITEINLPYVVSVAGWSVTLFFFALIYSVFIGVKLDLWEESIWYALKDWLTTKDYFEDDHKCGDVMEKMAHTKEDMTFLGGMTTIMFMLWAYSLLGLTAWLFVYYNEIVDQSLVPKTEENIAALRPYIAVTAKFLGYTGPCLTNSIIQTSGLC